MNIYTKTVKAQQAKSGRLMPFFVEQYLSYSEWELRATTQRLMLKAGRFITALLVCLVVCTTSSFAQTAATDDFDGDGIINSLDADDDNDGVLDFMEQNCPTVGTFTNWTSSIANTSATGTLALTSGNVTITYTSPTVNSIQNPNWYGNGDGYNGVLPSAGANGVASVNGVGSTHTYSFSQPLTNPILIFWSDNGNTYTFNKPFRVFGTPTTSHTIINSTSFSSSAEGAIAVQFIGTYSSISYTTSISEFWTGVTVGVQQCTDIDSDGDLTLNKFDLDSDGDTCSDAFESGATTSKTANYQFTGSVGANGILNTLETASENGTINYTSTYKYAVSAAQILCVDSDNDGVSDVIDIDDDNDGIADADECILYSPCRSTSAANLIVNGNFELGDVGFTSDYTLGGSIGTNTGWGPAASGTCSGGKRFGADVNQFAGNAINKDLWAQTVTVQPNTNYEFGFLAAYSNAPSQYHVFIDGVDVGNTGDLTNAWKLYSFALNFGSRTSVKISIRESYGLYGGDDSAMDDVYLLNISSTGVGAICDTDGDAIPNQLDLDSDGDGCSDAYEGGATTDKTVDYKFTTAVGTNGLADTLETVANNGIINYRTSYSSFALNNAKNKCSLQSPGGVITGLAWWYEGDAGVTTSGTAVTKWNDQSPSALDVTQTTVSRQPTNNKYQNFNKVMTFDGSDALNNATGFWQNSTNNANYNVFAVAKHTINTGSVNTLFTENTSLGQQILFYDYGNNTYTGFWASNYAYTPYTAAYSGVPQLLSSRYNNTGTVKTIGFNGKSQTVTSGGAAATFNGNNSNLVIGNYTDQGLWPLNGDIAEIAMYATDLTAVQRQQVESYLSLKWGVSIDQSTAYNYLNSSGAIVWNATTNSAYKNNIFGIGRDDAAGLNQKQSQSVSVGFQPVIGNGSAISATNAANTNSFTADKSFDIISDNGSAANYTVPYTPTSFTPVAAFYRMNKVWKVQETGTVGTVTIRVPNGSERLLVSSSAAFGAGTQEIALISDGAGNVTAQVDFNDGDFFSFGRIATGPGGVVVGTYACNTIQNSDFSTGVTNWTISAGWYDNGGTAYNYLDNVVDNTLKQTISGLNATQTPGQVKVTFDFKPSDYIAGSTLDVYLGGVKYLSFNNPAGSSPITTALFNSAIFGTVPTLTNNVWATIQLTIPWVSKPDIADLEFKHTAPVNGDDVSLDNISISGNCQGTLVTWLKANQGITASDSTAVSSWKDQSVTGYDVAQATATNQPLFYSTTASKLINFNPSVSFDGSNDYLNNTTPIFGTTTPYSFMMVGLDESTSTGYQTYFGAETGGNYFALLKGNGAATNNGWQQFTGASNPMKGTGYAPVGGASGYWNGTAYVADAKMQRSQAQIVGLNSANPVNANPHTFKTFIDGYASTGTLNGATGYQNQFFKSLSLGSYVTGGNPVKGRIPEFIAYNRQLTDVETQKVNTYLALKYGVTLGQGGSLAGVGNNAANYNYIAPNGDTIWNAATNSTYKFDITGIGTDAVEDLNQKQSRSINASTYVTLALGTAVKATNDANTANFGADKSYEIIGDNGLPARYATAYTPAFTTNGLFYYSMSRIWKVQETGTVGQVTVSIPFRGNNTYLLVKNSATFGSGATEILMTKDGKGNLFATVDFTNGDYFTFGSAQVAPGAVVSGIATWLKADAGVIDGGGIPADGAGIDTWNDQSFSATGYSVSQTTTSKQPLYYGQNASKLVNFNPSVYFDGTSGHVLTNNNTLFAGTSPFSFMMVGVDESTDGFYRKIFGSETPVDYFGLYKVTGAATNNGWSQYTVGNNFLKGTGYAPTGGASGYWNGTAYVADTKMQRIQAQVVGINSANPANTNPSTMKSFIDGYQSTATFAGITAYQNTFFKSLSIGGESGAEFWKGRIPEFVAYDRQLTDAETQKVNTYMAIKYGVTLGQGGNLASIGNNAANYSYIATNGDTIWNATANSTYKFDITAIGRDDAEALDQSQSKSVHASAYVTMALGNEIAVSNAANSNSFTADKSYEIIGDNGLNTGYSALYVPTTFTPIAPFYLMSRIWKVQETGTVGTVTLSVGMNGQEKLLVSNTAAFLPASTQEIDLTPDGNGNLTAQVDLTNGQFFTFGRALIAPGGVVTNLAVWTKANAGIATTEGGAVAAWTDQSPNSYNLAQATAANRPTYYSTTAAKLINFNPVLTFDGNDQIVNDGTLINDVNSPYTYVGTILDEATSTGEKSIFGTHYASSTNFSFKKENGATSYNGWSLEKNASHYYGVTGNANGFSPLGGSNGYFNGTNFTSNGNVQRFQPQVFGLNSLNADNASPMITFIDGYKNSSVANSGDRPNLFKNLGIGGTGGEMFTGRIPEFAAYATQIADADMQKINTYLAIKYGVTLGQGGSLANLNNNAANYNYLATDGSIVWNSTTNSTYKYDIAGIGRDDAEALTQKQSQSANTGVCPIISLGAIAATNEANSSTFAADKTYQIWGSNGLAAGYNNVYVPTTFSPTFPFKYMNRKWKVQETKTVGAVTVKINSNSDYMLVDTDGDGNFATGTITEVQLINKQCTYNFNNGDVFTFGREVIIQTCDKGLAFVHGDDAAASSNSSALGISAWISNGNGTFRATPVTQSGFNRDNTGSEVFGQDGVSATYTADMDNDGDKDIVHITENNSNSIYVYPNNGDGTFQTTPIVTTGFTSATNATFAGEDGAQQGWMGDANGDGKIDYIFSGDDKQIHVYLGNGNGTFALTRISSTLVANGYNTSGISGSESFLIADVNNDGSVDLVGSFDPQHMTVWLGNGDGTFQANPYFDSDIQDSGSSNSSGSAGNEYSQFADVDGDGDLDYVHAEGYDATPQIWAYLNNGDGTFVTTAVLTQATTNPAGDIGRFANYSGSRLSYFSDVNNDGKADFVTTFDDGTAAQNGIYVYLATSNGSFAVTPIATVIATGFATGTSSTETSFIACGIIICNAGVKKPLLSATTKTNVCPATTANLSTLTASNLPNGTLISWHTAAAATLANKIADPTTVAAGTYYAAFYDAVNGCFSGNGDSTTAVTVTITSPCPATFTFNCATASATGTFSASGSGGQTGTLTIPLTSATVGSATFTVTGTGFTGTLSTTLTAAQASVAIPITYDGTGAVGSRILTVTSTGGAGTCTPSVTVGGAVATYTFNCAGATSTGTFAANGTSGQTGTLTIGLTGTTLGSVTYTVTGAGFTGSYVGSLTAGQTSVAIPISYDGTGIARTQTLTVTGTGSTGTCTPSVSVICGAGATAPNLASTTISNACPIVNANLASIAVGNKPSGSVMTWHTGTPATSANKVPDSTSVAAGTYYAAFYNVSQACYGGATSGAATAAVTVTLDVCPADISVSNVCPTNSVNLTTRINGTVPAGKVVTWHTALPTTTLNKVGNPTAVMNGTYYAAFYDSVNDCYSPGSPNGIVVSITLCQTSRSGVVPPTMSATTLSNVCPATVANLSTLTTSNLPVGTSLTWHSGSTADNTNIVSGITAVGAGTYYSAFFDDLANTYSPTTAVTVTITTCVTCEAGYAKPELSATTKSNTCPTITANLGTITPSYLPVGTTLSWHTAAHATLLNKVVDSSAVAAGTYYATFYDKVNGCFSGNGDSTTAVVVTINSCSTPDLITIIGQPTPILTVGQTSSLPIKIQNIGGVSAPGIITTTIILPTGTSAPATFISNGSTCATVGQTVTCTNAGPIAANDSIKILVPVTPNASLMGTSPVFNATVAPVLGETNTSNNAATPTAVTTPVAGVPDLTTTIGQPTPALVVGQASSVPITIKNIGTGSAPGIITTTMTLPTGTSAPATFTSNGSTCATSGQTVTCTNAGPIAAGDSIKILVPVTPNASIVGTNPIFNGTTAPVTGETNTGNNVATPTTTTTAVTSSTIKVSAKVFLSGSYVTLAGMMHDSLRVKGLIPSAQPYSSMGYTGTETVAPSVLLVTGANAIVDWVLVELRSDATTVVTKRAGLVQRDGDIVDVDGVTPLSFTAASGSYYVVVKHRNHLGVMSGSAIALSPTTTTVDFTSILTTNYQITGVFGSVYAQRTLGSVRGLWGGNTGGGVTLKASGTGSDAEAVYFKVLLDAGNTSFSPSYIIYNIYAREDATMDGKIIYQGTGSEVDGILFNVLLHLNNAGVLPTFVIYEQIP